MKKKKKKYCLFYIYDCFHVLFLFFIFFLAFEMKTFVHGQFIIRQGTKGSSFYVVDRGVVEVEVTNSDGEKKILADSSTGYYFGERALLMNKDAVRGASVIAKGMSCVLDKKNITLP